MKKCDPTSLILIEQGEEGKSITRFEDPVLKTLIEVAFPIFDTTCSPNIF